MYSTLRSDIQWIQMSSNFYIQLRLPPHAFFSPAFPRRLRFSWIMSSFPDFPHKTAAMFSTILFQFQLSLQSPNSPGLTLSRQKKYPTFLDETAGDMSNKWTSINPNSLVNVTYKKWITVRKKYRWVIRWSENMSTHITVRAQFIRISC